MVAGRAAHPVAESQPPAVIALSPRWRPGPAGCARAAGRTLARPDSPTGDLRRALEQHPATAWAEPAGHQPLMTRADPITVTGDLAGGYRPGAHGAQPRKPNPACCQGFRQEGMVVGLLPGCMIWCRRGSAQRRAEGQGRACSSLLGRWSPRGNRRQLGRCHGDASLDRRSCSAFSICSSGGRAGTQRAKHIRPDSRRCPHGPQ